MLENNLLDYITRQIKTKLRLRQMLDPMINEVLQDIPLIVRASVIKLQRSDVIPNKTLRFLASVKREKKYKADGEVEYSYIKLPVNFREMKEFYVVNGASYRFVNSISDTKNYTNTICVDSLPMYEGKEEEPILVISPYPGDNYEIVLRYYEDAHDVDLNNFDERYWDVILSEVERRLEIKSEYEATQDKVDFIHQENHKEGFRGRNQYRRKTPRYFGK